MFLVLLMKETLQKSKSLDFKLKTLGFKKTKLKYK